MKTLKMKTLLFVSLIILFSCKKESTYCWTCNTVTTYEATHYQPQSETTVNTWCDLSEQDIRSWEREKSGTVTIKIGLTTAKTITSVTCKKK